VIANRLAPARRCPERASRRRRHGLGRRRSTVEGVRRTAAFLAAAHSSRPVGRGGGTREMGDGSLRAPRRSASRRRADQRSPRARDGQLTGDRIGARSVLPHVRRRRMTRCIRSQHAADVAAMPGQARAVEARRDDDWIHATLAARKPAGLGSDERSCGCEENFDDESLRAPGCWWRCACGGRGQPLDQRYLPVFVTGLEHDFSGEPQRRPDHLQDSHCWSAVFGPINGWILDRFGCDAHSDRT